MRLLHSAPPYLEYSCYLRDSADHGCLGGANKISQRCIFDSFEYLPLPGNSVGDLRLEECREKKEKLFEVLE